MSDDRVRRIRELADERFPCECEHCDAFTTVRPCDPDHPQLLMITVHHENFCPVLDWHPAS
jgi:hypothetical protein